MNKRDKERLKDAICGISLIGIFLIVFYPPEIIFESIQEEREERERSYVEENIREDSLWRQEWKHRLDPDVDTGEPYKLPPIPENIKFENAVLGLLDLYY